MATREEIMERAKQLIISDPTAGKNRINARLKAEFDVGLRSNVILDLKREVAVEQPKLYPSLYSRGSVTKALNAVYRGWINSGFLPFEARELTIGHGERYKNFDAKAVFDSEAGKAAREFRMGLIQDQRMGGWSNNDIRANIVDYYLKGKTIDPWEHIRAEYRPRKKIDHLDYKAKIQRRFKEKQRRLLGR